MFLSLCGSKRTVLSVAISTSHTALLTVRILSLMTGALMADSEASGFWRVSLGLGENLKKDHTKPKNLFEFHK